jgi:hypothetical protein
MLLINKLNEFYVSNRTLTNLEVLNFYFILLLV